MGFQVGITLDPITPKPSMSLLPHPKVLNEYISSDSLDHGPYKGSLEKNLLSPKHKNKT